MSLTRIAAATPAALIAAWLLMYNLGLAAGSSESERRRLLPGVELVPRPDIVTDHSLDLC